MDEETMVVLAIQLLALCCIAAALVVYLVCKVKGRRRAYDSQFPALDVGTGRSVLVTSCDTLFGIQLALHLTSLGFRVFAGVKAAAQPASCQAAAILRAKLKQREAASTALVGADEYAAKTAPTFGTLVTVPLDVTREDSLHEALEHVRRHLPAGEDGKSRRRQSTHPYSLRPPTASLLLAACEPSPTRQPDSPSSPPPVPPPTVVQKACSYEPRLLINNSHFQATRGVPESWCEKGTLKEINGQLLFLLRQ